MRKLDAYCDSSFTYNLKLSATWKFLISQLCIYDVKAEYVETALEKLPGISYIVLRVRFIVSWEFLTAEFRNMENLRLLNNSPLVKYMYIFIVKLQQRVELKQSAFREQTQI